MFLLGWLGVADCSGLFLFVLYIVDCFGVGLIVVWTYCYCMLASGVLVCWCLMGLLLCWILVWLLVGRLFVICSERGVLVCLVGFALAVVLGGLVLRLGCFVPGISLLCF